MRTVMLDNRLRSYFDVGNVAGIIAKRLERRIGQSTFRKSNEISLVTIN